MSTAKSTWEATDKTLPDHLPCCPRCGDLNDPGAHRCDGCNSPLYMVGVKPPKPLALVQGDRLAVPSMELWWKARFTDAQLAELAGWVA